MSKNECKAAIRRLWDEGFNQGNLALLEELCDARHVTHDPGMPELPAGPAGMRLVLSTYREALDGACVTVDELFGGETKVVARWSAISPALLRPGSGLSVYRFEGGKIVETWSRCDALDPDAPAIASLAV